MAEKTFNLRILTPGKTLLDDEVSLVILRTLEGDMGILAKHEPCVVALDSGVMRIRRDGVPETYLVMGGFAVVKQQEVVVTSNLAERSDRMEALLQSMEQQRQKRKQEGARWESEVTRAEVAIRRVLMGQEISAYSILKGRGEKGERL